MRPSLPPLPDAAMAVGFAVVAGYDSLVGIDPPAPPMISVGFAVVGAGALAWRRRAPLSVLVVLAVCGVVPHLLTGGPPSFYGGYLPLLVSEYTAAAYAAGRRSLAAPVAGALVYLALAARGTEFRTVNQVLFIAMTTAGAYGAGRAVHAFRERADRAGAEVDLLAQAGELLAQEAVTSERQRIARELHDVIAHDVSVMVIHAGAAERLVDGDPAEARQALREVQAAGRKAIEELSLVLGMLRGAGEPPVPGPVHELTPPPGLAGLDELLAPLRRVGLAVELAVAGQPRVLPAALELSAYRIVQEALTNVLKHSRAGRVEVLLRYTDAGVTVEVSDDGRQVPGSSPAQDRPAVVPGVAAGTGGNGVVGMRERVRVFGGSLQAGPRPGGGFSVRATLPAACVSPLPAHVAGTP